MSARQGPALFLVPYCPPHRSTIARKMRPAITMVRRRPDMHQGRALEILGHAIEYLVDSRMFLVSEPDTRFEGEALKILARSSREVFAMCAEVVPVSHRLKVWATGRLRLKSLEPSGPSAVRRS